MEGLKFVEYNKEFLEKSWDWLNDTEIKKMIMSSDVTKTEQLKWYEKLAERKDYYIWGIKFNSEAIGAVGIKNIDFNSRKGEYFGYIGEKEYWGRGIGSEMLDYIISFAIQQGLKEIYLRVSNDNKRAIRLYEKKGFFYDNKNADDDVSLLFIQID